MTGGADVRNIPVEANRPRLRRDLPLRCAEKDTDMGRTNGGHAGRDGFGFKRMVDRGKDNTVGGDVNNDAATREVGYDFVFLGRGRRAPRESESEEE